MVMHPLPMFNREPIERGGAGDYDRYPTRGMEAGQAQCPKVDSVTPEAWIARVEVPIRVCILWRGYWNGKRTNRSFRSCVSGLAHWWMISGDSRPFPHPIHCYSPASSISFEGRINALPSVPDQSWNRKVTGRTHYEGLLVCCRHSPPLLLALRSSPPSAT